MKLKDNFCLCCPEDTVDSGCISDHSMTQPLVEGVLRSLVKEAIQQHTKMLLQVKGLHLKCHSTGVLI